MKAAQPPQSVFQPGRHLEVLDEPIHDPYQEGDELSEPAVCSDCGAVYLQGRWQWITPSAHAIQVRCAACRRIRDKLPAGQISMEGQFASARREELLDLVRHLETLEKAEHPLRRIMSIEEQNDKLLIAATDIQLVRVIREALEQAYQGSLDFHYDKDGAVLRARWKDGQRH